MGKLRCFSSWYTYSPRNISADQVGPILRLEYRGTREMIFFSRRFLFLDVLFVAEFVHT